MKIKKQVSSIVLLLLGLGSLHAQEATTASGGKSTGALGVVNYSVGQIVYTTNTGQSGSVSQGVQQTYEISTTVGINEKSITLALSVYPNPTANQLTLKVEKVDNLSFQLFDISGRVIEKQTISNEKTTINLEGQPSAVYFLSVYKEDQTIKTFKVIKN